MRELKNLSTVLVLLLIITLPLGAKPYAPEAGRAAEPVIDRTSIQVTTQEHRGYYSNGKLDETTWSWTPRIAFRVNGPVPQGSQLEVEYFLPGNKSWLKVDCETGEVGAGQFWQVGNPPCGNNMDDEKGITYTGPMTFRISLRNELQGASKTLFNGKMNVKRVRVGPDLPVNKNHFDYYIDHDWNLPIGYVYAPEEEEYSEVAPLAVSLWFRGDTNKVAAYLFYKGQEISNTAVSSKGTSNQEVDNQTFEASPYIWRRMRFTFFNALLFNREESDSQAGAFRMDKNPGEYEIKVLRGGKLVRTAKFQIGTDGKLVDNRIAANNSLGTTRIIMPVQVLGNEDADYDPASWRSMAFYGDALGGFTAP